MHADTIRLVFHMFFASLNLMLVFSAGIIFFGAVYRSPETRLLLSLPVRDERIALHKFQEALLYSCWGFFLLASPMLLAYGVVVHAPWYYYVLLLPMIVSFVYVPCAIGSGAGRSSRTAVRVARSASCVCFPTAAGTTCASGSISPGASARKS